MEILHLEVYAMLNPPAGRQHDPDPLRHGHSEPVSESQSYTDIRKGYKGSGVTRGNRFEGVTKGNSFDNQQNSISKWGKTVTSFKLLKTNKLNEKDRKTTHLNLLTEYDTF